MSRYAKSRPLRTFDISRNCDDSVETWEATFARRFRDAAALEAAIAKFGDREES